MKPLEIRLVKSFQVCQIIRKSFSPRYFINETLMFLKPKRYSWLCPGTQMHAHHCLLYRHGNTGIFLLRECHYSRFGPTSAVSYVCYTSYLLLREKNIFACWTLNLRGLCVAELLKVAFTYTRNEIGFDICGLL